MAKRVPRAAWLMTAVDLLGDRRSATALSCVHRLTIIYDSGERVAMTHLRSKTNRFDSEQIAGFLEAVYQLETDDQAWLVDTMRAARAVSNRGETMHGAIYDASDVAALRIETIHAMDVPDGGLDWLVDSVKWMTPQFVATTFRSQLVDTASALAGPEWRQILRGLHDFGFADSLNINGLDPQGIGAFFVIWRRDDDPIPAAERTLYRRMAHHLAAAYRFRRRLSAEQYGTSGDLVEGAEAVLDSRGHVVHAVGPATPRAVQSELLETAKVRDLARTAKVQGAEGIGRWPPLTSARWTLVDVFERNGQRYIVARENQATVRGLSLLTDRERQVVAYLAIGQSTKETAYALGVSDVTVRVLLRRAVSKLGLRTRSELFAHPDVQRLSPGSAAKVSEPTVGIRHTTSNPTIRRRPTETGK